MAVNKLIPRYLNKDDDSRLVKSTEMTDALNVRISSDDDGDALVLKNAYGNEAITLQNALPSGTNKVIGATANEQGGSIYYFVWNSNDDHTIYRYSVGTDKAAQVMKSSVLEFGKNGYVKGNVVTSSDGDELLYFNTGTSEPKKVNASKALRAGYPSQFYSGTDEEKLLYITAAKQPPLSAPSYNIVNNGALKENRISDKVFQFAYRYVYQDGEVSALSPYSSLTASIAQLRDGFNTQSAIDFYNQIDVYVKNTIADVELIQLFAREGNEGTFYEVGERDNDRRNSDSVTISFTNSFRGPALSSTDQRKLFDNVPQLADSQEIANGRLMYGGYTEGYPNTLEADDVSLIDNYKGTEKIYDLAITAASDATNTKITFDLDTGGIPATFTNDSTIYINVVMSGDKVTIGGNTPSSHLDFDDINVIVSDLDGSNVETVLLQRTKDEVEFIPSGISISETINIDSGTTKAEAMTAIRNRLTSRKYNMMLAPTADQTVVFAETGNEFDKFTAQLNGRAIIQPKELTSSEIELDIVGLEMSLGGVEQPISPAKLLKTFGLGLVGGAVGTIAKYGGPKEFVSKVFKDDKEKQIVSSALIEMDINSGDNIAYQFTSPFVLGASFISDTADSSGPSFKSGSSHKMGIVYYDDRNRSGGVQELGDVYIKPLNNRSDENDLHGSTSIVMRLPDAAPSWARRWAPVYQGKGNSVLRMMYSIDGAFVPYRVNSTVQLPANNNKIYLSLNSLFDPEMGYNASTGASLEYEYQKGDRLRVVEYDGSNRTTYEFPVAGRETLLQDNNNPILDNASARTISRTTGEFLIIEEDVNASGFNIKSIIDRTTNWNKRCVVEIYNTSSDASDIYYEVGKTYDVTSGVHEDERTATSLNITISERSGVLQNNFSGTSSVKLFKGDILSVSSTKLNITNTYERGGVFYYHGDSRDNNPLPLDAYAATVDNPEKVVDIELGDVYFRRRSLYTSVTNEKLISGEKANRPSTAIVRYIEDYSVSDFFNSKSVSIGRPIAPILNAKTVKRSGSITYSEPYLQDGKFNGLSSFNLALANFKDLSYEHGSIKGLVGYNERLYFIQENRSGVLAVSRNVINTGSGDNLVTLSNNILQSEQYYVGEYGTSNPESVAHRDGMVYFTDVKRGKVLRIDSQGLTIISDSNMSSYFDDKFGIISKYSPRTVVAGVDKDNDEYIISSDSITEARVTINTNEYEYTAQIDYSGTQVLADYQYNPSAVFSFNTEPRTFNDMCDEFQDSVSAVVYLEELEDGGVVYVDQPYQTSTLYGVATNKDFDFFVSINVNMFLPGFTFDNSYCNSDDTGAIASDASVLSAFTVAYGTNDRAWTTRYSYIPEAVVSLHNDLYTFKSGKIYKHTENASRNTFYGGSTAGSIIEVVANARPSSIKTFESLSLEGDASWDATISTTDQSSVIANTSFKEKEGFYYAYIHGATSTYGSSISSVKSTSEIFSLGTVAADVSGGNAITFDNAINTITFPLGSTATVYKLNGSQLDSLSVYPLTVTGQKSLTLSGNVTVSDGDLLVVVGNSSIEGDQIRDYFAKIKLEKTTSSAIELYAVNAVVADSKLHN